MQFVETFDNDQGLDRFDKYVFHRNVDIHNFGGFSGGSWTGDHDESCGSPDTQRNLDWYPNYTQAQRQNAFYTCRNHMMTSMGDVDAYSIVAFSPKQVFVNPTIVCIDVNLTNLGTRQWWKIGVVKDGANFMVSDVSASDLPDITGSDKVIASWSGPGAFPAKLRIGNSGSNGPTANPTPNDKATRHEVCLKENSNNTITFTVAGVSLTRPGQFPEGNVRVYFYDHNYTPDKDGTPQGHTWHWDNVYVK